MRALIVLLVLTLAACAPRQAQAPAVIPADQREPAPAITGEGLDGEPLALGDYAGRPVVLNFWASWCGPCVTEAPQIQTVADQYGERVQVLGVDIQDSVPSAKTFERDLGIRYPSFFDPSVQVAAQFQDFLPTAPPVTLVLDAEHRVAVTHFGAVTAEELRFYLDQVL